MGRICYGVMGDARGHISRALTIAGELGRHEFLFIGGEKIQIMQENGYRIEMVPTAPTIIRHNRVDTLATAAHGLVGLARMAPAISRVRAVIREFDPQLIISDYELVSQRTSQLMGRPCVSLDNQHLLTHCRYKPPPGQKLSRFATCFLIRYLYSGAGRFLITSFHHLPPADPACIEVFPPLIKPKVQKLEPTPGEHVLVYLRGGNSAGLVDRLKKSRRRFHIYGLGKRPSHGNLVFKKTSEDEFLADLASCRYVIGNGGHSLLSEALYLGKPILCLPIFFFYEHYFNAYFVKKNGLGDYLWDIACRRDFIQDFEDHLEQYGARIKQQNFFGNHQIAARLEQLISGEAAGR